MAGLSKGISSGGGKAEAVLVDFETGERYSSGRLQLFPGDAFDLDFSGGEPHTLKYEDKDSFLSISFDGEVRRIIVRSDRFDADLSCHDAGDPVVTAADFGSRSRFACIYKKNFLDLAGYVHMHKLDYRLDGETFLVLSSGRGLWPYVSSQLWLNAAWEYDGRVVALNLGDNYGTDGPVTENALFVDG